MVEIIALNSQDTQKFAENVCFDYNPIHKAANNPQYLPGDWLFLKYLEHQGLPKAQTLTFKGNGGVSPEEIIEVKENEIDFWNNKFHTTPECTSLKQHVAGYIDTKAERKTFIVPEELSLKIRNFCKQYTKSAFSLFMSVMYIYIYRITMKKDIVLGTPILNRSNIKEKETFGMFISTIPVRMTVDENLSFNEYIEMVSKELMLFLKNQKYPFELILRDFRETNNTSDSLYDVVVSYQNASLDKTTYLENYKGRWHFNENQVSIKAGCP